jgi:hypothetical protein
VPTDQVTERGVIVRDEHAGDQFGIGHDWGGWPAGGFLRFKPLNRP